MDLLGALQVSHPDLGADLLAVDLAADLLAVDLGADPLDRDPELSDLLVYLPGVPVLVGEQDGLVVELRSQVGELVAQALRDCRPPRMILQQRDQDQLEWAPVPVPAGLLVLHEG